MRQDFVLADRVDPRPGGPSAGDFPSGREHALDNEAHNAFSHQFIGRRRSPGAKEDVLLGVAAQDDVIKTAGDVKTRLRAMQESMVELAELCSVNCPRCLPKEGNAYP